MCFTRKKCCNDFSYTINAEKLAKVFDHNYLGVYFTAELSWRRHIEYVTCKASSVLGFLRRNARNLPIAAKELLYKANVRPIHEYACCVWDPWQQVDIQRIERIQNLAVRFVHADYTRHFSVTSAKESLGWESLQQRRQYIRLKFFHSIFHNNTGINRDFYMHNPDYV